MNLNRKKTVIMPESRRESGYHTECPMTQIKTYTEQRWQRCTSSWLSFSNSKSIRNTYLAWLAWGIRLKDRTTKTLKRKRRENRRSRGYNHGRDSGSRPRSLMTSRANRFRLKTLIWTTIKDKLSYRRSSLEIGSVALDSRAGRAAPTASPLKYPSSLPFALTHP